MNRRQYLAGVGGGIAGCLTSPTTEPNTRSRPTPVVGEDGAPSDICERRPRSAAIPAIVEPAFAADYADVPLVLSDLEPVIGIERDGEARAYPLGATNEIVNDTFGEPILVTYCPLCASGLTASRRIDGRAFRFENTSYTWRPPTAAGEAALESERVFGVGYRENPSEAAARNDPNLVLFDRETESYWSQLLARAICGPRTGTTLSLIPSTVTDWGRWRERHPETSVLLPPPHSKTVLAA